MDGMSDIEKLLAIEEIKFLHARRDRAADAKDWETYEALHAPNHFSLHEGRQRWANPSEMVANARRITEELTTVHHSHTPEISFQSPTKASGVWALEDNAFWKQGDEEHWLNAYGYYFETYEKQDGRWLFTSRELKWLHRRISPGGVLPYERARGGSVD